jgi:hypothetical protein
MNETTTPNGRSNMAPKNARNPKRVTTGAHKRPARIIERGFRNYSGRVWA